MDLATYCCFFKSGAVASIFHGTLPKANRSNPKIPNPRAVSLFGPSLVDKQIYTIANVWAHKITAFLGKTKTRQM